MHALSQNGMPQAFHSVLISFWTKKNTVLNKQLFTFKLVKFHYEIIKKNVKDILNRIFLIQATFKSLCLNMKGQKPHQLG